MKEYYDYKIREKKASPLLTWIFRVFVFFFLLALFFFWNTTALSKPAQTELNTKTLVKTAFTFLKKDSGYPIKGEEEDRINILFLGVPGVGNSAPNLTDSIILASIRPSTNQLALLSIPRDLLVYLEKERYHTKINSLFVMNEKSPELLNEEIKEITGQEVHYYLVLNTTAVKDVVDALGGLNVFVKKDIYDPAFPTINFGTELFEVKQGWRYFDGDTVQKYLRTRHSQNGDFDRMQQQQAVIEALRKKVFGLNLLLDFPTILSLVDVISKNIQTDISEHEIKKLHTILKDVSYDKIINEVLNGGEKDSLLISDSFMFGEQKGFVLKPRAGEFDYSEIVNLANNIFSNDK